LFRFKLENFLAGPDEEELDAFVIMTSKHAKTRKTRWQWKEKGKRSEEQGNAAFAIWI